MNTESRREISGEQKELKKCILYEGDSSRLEHCNGIKRTAVIKRERQSTPQRTEFNDDGCEEEEEEEEEEEGGEKTKTNQKKKKYQQRYSAKYENDPMFKGWIKASSRGSSYAYCIPCSAHLKITAGKHDLRKHTEMKKHKANVQASQAENCITAYVLGQDQPIASVELPFPEKDSKFTKRKRYSQRYNHTFEEDPVLEGWVTASTKGEHYAHCIPCDVDLRIASGKLDLKRHAKNKKHIAAKAELDQKLLCSKMRDGEHCITDYISAQDNPMTVVDLPMNTVQIQTSLEELEDIQRSPMALEMNPMSRSSANGRDKEDPSVLASRLHEAELQIASFIARHGLSLEASDHLIQLIRNVCPYSSVAQNLECEGTDMVSLINNVLGKEGCEEVMQLLRENKFSLIVDESTGRGLEKHLNMAVRVLHNSSIIDAFLGLIPMKEATANSLYSDVIKFFRNNLIPYKNNMIGIAADGGNTVLADDCHSLSSLMKEDISRLFVMKCVPHSFSLCVSCACLKLPRSLEDLARDVYSYFHFSPNHIELEGFEAFTSAKPHKLLHSAQTRWLSMHAVVSKLLEKYDALKLYFTNATLLDKLEAPETILQRLSIPVTKLYLMFLDFVLPIFDNLDRHMQSESTQVHVLHNAVGVALKAIFECYLEDGYLRSTALEDVKYDAETNFKPMEEMYLGIKVQMEITNLSLLQQEDLKDFRMNCLQFLIEGVSQIRKRFPYGCQALKSLENLNPKVVIEKNVPSLIDLIYNFENLASPDIQVVDSEWRLLRNMIDTVPVSAGMRPEQFWNTVSKTRQIDNVLMCPNLSQFMLKLLCLPSATAAVEKVFSTINKMKSRSKNISSETLMGILYTNQVIPSKS